MPRGFDSPHAPRHVAVVGGGISGLATAWLLARRHHVTLFEAAPYLGGHTNTVDVTLGGTTFPVDTGFLVFNERTYPNLCALFEHLGVAAADSEMSFSVRCDQEGLEWAGTSLATVFAQPRNLVSAEFWGMLKDIVRFNRDATRRERAGTPAEGSLGAFLDAGGYGRAFREWYLLPMSAAIWSCPTQAMLAYPAATFLRFCHNHGLLQLAGRPQWRTVAGGGREYVRRLASGIPDARTGTPVRSVTREAGRVRIATPGGAEFFDDVVMATHSDVTLRLLQDADADERRVLAAVRYQDNRACLHTDPALLPRRKTAWAAWNYLAGGSGIDGRPVSVSYLINRLQPLPVETPVIVTLNPVQEPDPAALLGTFHYAHPVFDDAAIAAQRRLRELQGRRGTWFCGAWTGHGFHEDGLASALAVAGGFGVHAPWSREAVAA